MLRYLFNKCTKPTDSTLVNLFLETAVRQLMVFMRTIVEHLICFWTNLMHSYWLGLLMFICLFHRYAHIYMVSKKVEALPCWKPLRHIYMMWVFSFYGPWTIINLCKEFCCDHFNIFFSRNWELMLLLTKRRSTQLENHNISQLAAKMAINLSAMLTLRGQWFSYFLIHLLR